MSIARVLIFAPSDPTGESHRMLEAQGCELLLGKAAWDKPHGDNEAEMAAMASRCDALTGTSLRSSPITQRILASAANLRIVAKYTIGVDDIDVEAATELGILVTHSPTESNWGGVAEGTVTSMLTMLKKVRERDRHLKEGGWKDDRLLGTHVGSRGDGYAGITLGLIGLGRVGGRVANLMRPWHMRILAYDPYLPDSRFAEHGVQRVDNLPTLLRESDVVSLHVVLNRQTRHMIGAEELSMMKPSALFMNTARGFCVDEQALVEALQNDRIAGAAIDAFEHEPLAEDSPLRALGDKVLLSPHMISANVGSGLGPGIRWASESVLHALRGEVPDCVYNTEVIPRWQQRFGGKSLLRP